MSEQKPDQITMRGDRIHNLKGIDVVHPHNVLSGASCSGKCSRTFYNVCAKGRKIYFTYENFPHISVEFAMASGVNTGGFCPEKNASCNERPAT
jgi:hypothetical protein